MSSICKLVKIDPFMDKRGVLKKVFMKSRALDENRIEEVYLIYTKQNSVRGNHYHKKTFEYFTVVSGRAKVALEDFNLKTHEEFYLCEDDNLVLCVPPLIVHSFFNEESRPLIILALSSREYNRDDTDTFAVEII